MEEDGFLDVAVSHSPENYTRAASQTSEVSEPASSSSCEERDNLEEPVPSGPRTRSSARLRLRSKACRQCLDLQAKCTGNDIPEECVACSKSSSSYIQCEFTSGTIWLCTCIYIATF